MRPSEAVSVFARRHRWAKRALLRFIPNIPRTILVAGIGPMRIKLRDHRSYWLRDPLEHDRLFLGGISNLVEPGMVVWDVGAHIGLYTRLFAQVMDAGRVVAFEPDSKNQALLRGNLRLGGIEERATLMACAVGAADGGAEFLSDSDSTQQGHLAGVQGDEPSGVTSSVRVEVRTIDSLVESGECPPPGLIKIDVEGAEEAVLTGARRTLANHSSRLAIELHQFAVRLPVMQLLEEAGYTVYGYRARKWRQLTSDDFREPTSLYDPRHIYAARDADVLKKPALFIDL
jgi:FkbM family methyltransferase